ncbi:MAG TPA: SusE domain-containing protein [Bacteroidales bacterium]|nr:SusE domain-containing protein [Bacteroidales bacterium]
MKKISLILAAIFLVGSFACKKQETKATLNANATAPVLLNMQEGATIVLKKSDSAVVIDFTWTTASFGQTVVTTYMVQMDKQGNDFASAVTLGVVTNGTQISLSTYDFNNKLLAMEPDPTNPDLPPLALEFRVQATISSYYPASNSTTVHQTITPYFVKIVYPLLFVPGDYQGWNPADSSTSIASVGANTKYQGYIWFGHDNTQYKYCQGPSWTTNWGDDGADGTLNPGGANIVAGPKGYYKLDVDLGTLTHKFLRTDWSIVGDASGGWDADKDMVYDSIAKEWTLTLPLTAAGMKFRANHAWDLNYGDNNANGTLQEGGANIMVPAAGNYKVILNLSGAIYRYKLQAQ